MSILLPLAHSMARTRRRRIIIVVIAGLSAIVVLSLLGETPELAEYLP